MAGDWIKVEAVTPDKPEVHAIAEELGVTPEEVLGRLFRVWIWADQHTVFGDALSVTDALLDSVARLRGFANSMRNVGWLKGSGKVVFPNFERHNGKTAKNRALTKDRMKRHRDGDNVTVPSPEKRREEGNSCEGVITGTTTPENQVSSSTKTRAGRPKANGYSADAYELLAFLNERAGKNFRPVAVNLALIDARLKSGVAVDDARAVVARKCREWKDRPEMQRFLRPETIFGQSKFEQYLGEVGTVVVQPELTR